VRLVFNILLLQSLFFGLFPEYSFGKVTENTKEKALSIVKQNAVLLDGIHQLLVVFNDTPEQNTAVLVAMEKKGKIWRPVFAPMQAGIGRNGFAASGAKREGDQMSPTGFFRLGQLFCNERKVDTRMPFIQSTIEDKWIDDPESADYNQYVRGETQAKSYEKLLLNGNDYRYCMVIEYNTHPVVKGNGSAIFLHLSEGREINSSSGCIVLLQSDMEQLIRWMSPELRPSILMGNEKTLMVGLK
jgi:L,D-peptidoglycan transpeptidase YkuD (ErfK/YbiS/YcfS/YnhG family)